MIHDTQSAQISQKQDGRNIYAIMKTMCPAGYHHNGFVATHALGHIHHVHHVPKCISCHKAIVVITGRAHCFHGKQLIDNKTTFRAKSSKCQYIYKKEKCFSKYDI